MAVTRVCECCQKSRTPSRRAIDRLQSNCRVAALSCRWHQPPHCLKQKIGRLFVPDHIDPPDRSEIAFEPATFWGTVQITRQDRIPLGLGLPSGCGNAWARIFTPKGLSHRPLRHRGTAFGLPYISVSTAPIGTPRTSACPCSRKVATTQSWGSSNGMIPDAIACSPLYGRGEPQVFCWVQSLGH